jgi:acyl-coenzyme A synthetase/AMP-(fatty) acid ligase
LLTTTNASHAVFGGGSAILDLRDHVTTSLEQDGHSALDIISFPTLQDLYPELSKSKPQEFKPFSDVVPTGDESTVIILHSSGSTGLPRPVNFHQKGVLCNVLQQRE